MLRDPEPTGEEACFIVSRSRRRRGREIARHSTTAKRQSLRIAPCQCHPPPHFAANATPARLFNTRSDLGDSRTGRGHRLQRRRGTSRQQSDEDRPRRACVSLCATYAPEELVEGNVRTMAVQWGMTGPGPIDDTNLKLSLGIGGFDNEFF